MKKKKMVDEMIIGVIKEALLRMVEPTAQVVNECFIINYNIELKSGFFSFLYILTFIQPE